MVIPRISDTRYIFGDKKAGARLGNKSEKVYEQVIARIIDLTPPHKTEPLARRSADQPIEPSIRKTGNGEQLPSCQIRDTFGGVFGVREIFEVRFCGERVDLNCSRNTKTGASGS